MWSLLIPYPNTYLERSRQPGERRQDCRFTVRDSNREYTKHKTEALRIAASSSVFITFWYVLYHLVLSQSTPAYRMGMNGACSANCVRVVSRRSGLPLSCWCS